MSCTPSPRAVFQYILNSVVEANEKGLKERRIARVVGEEEYVYALSLVVVFRNFRYGRAAIKGVIVRKSETSMPGPSVT